MAKGFGEKLKLLYVKDYLYAYSDEDHPVSVSDIINHLADEYELFCERKGIYKDIKILSKTEEPDDEDYEEDDDDVLIQSYGMDIRRKGRKYYLGERDFGLQEIKLLVDMVESSSNIPHETAKALIEKLQKQTTVYNRKYLERHVDIRNQVRSLNEQFQESADKIFEAIKNDQNIAFQYFTYGVNKIKELKRRGKVYEVSPFALVWVDQNYYMMAYALDAKEMRTFRVDRMTGVKLKKGPRSGKREFEKLTGGNLPAYINKVFHMYIGEVKTVTMKFNKALVDTVIDRFGEDVMLHPSDSEHFTVTTEVAVSPQFYGWLAGFGSLAELVAPNDEREKMIMHLKGAMNLYK